MSKTKFVISTKFDPYDDQFMRMALKQAEKAKKSKKQFPIGAVIVRNGEVIASAFSDDKHSYRPGDHAERLVIDKASKRLHGRMTGCTLYTTAEPCQMCMSAFFQAGIHEVVFAAYRENLPMRGKRIKLEDLIEDASYIPRVVGGCLEEESLELFRKRGFKVSDKKP